MQTERKIVRNIVNRVISSALEDGRHFLLEYEAEQVTRSYGIPTVRGEISTTESEAVSIARKLGYPVVMKIVSPEILHKSDVGGVRVGVSKPNEVRKSHREILRNIRKANRRAKIIGVYLQEMAPKSQEFVVGGTRDPQFGPTIMFGLGGIYVELFKDVAFRLAPLTIEEALSMTKEIKAAPLLTGFRGSKPLDVNAVAKTLVSVANMMTDNQRIDSVDINPLLVYERGVRAVDVRIILNAETTLESQPVLSVS